MDDRPEQIGQYRIEKLLGEGGMGAVYLGVHRLLGSRAAIKMILHGILDQDEAIPRLIDEGRALANLHDPHIVGVLDLFAEGRNHYLVMEYVEGETLDRRLCRGAVEIAEALDLAIQIGGGVASAHRQGILHRDIKPQNVMLGRGGAVKVMDFGLAKFADATTKTRSGFVVGTPRYMSPEQVTAKPLDARSDQYSYGVLLYRLLCGREPFIDGDTVSIAYQHIHGIPPSPLTYNKLIPPTLAAIVLKALAKDPGGRYADMPEMLRELKRVRESLPEAIVTFVQPSPATENPSSRRPAGKFWALGAAALAAGAGFIAWQTRRQHAPAVIKTLPAASAPAMPLITNAERSSNRWVAIPPARPAVLLGLRDEAAPASVAGFRPSRGVRSPDAPYEIQQHEVTWGEIEQYARQNAMEINYGNELSADDRLKPAAGLPWQAALEYCQSIGASLPTEAQWEFAARGAERRPYPWGDAPPDRELTSAYGVTPAPLRMIMSSAQDRTPGDSGSAIYDLLGNAQEWTADPWSADSPAQGADAPGKSGGEIFRAVRGLPNIQTAPTQFPLEGAAARFPVCSEGGCLSKFVAERQNIGFRCVKSP